MNKPLEADWKKYCALVLVVRERHLAKSNAKAITLLTDSKRNETERFWDAMEAMEKEARVLRLCMDHHARSQMNLSILAMLRNGLMTRKDLAGFSQEVQDLADVAEELDGKR